MEHRIFNIKITPLKGAIFFFILPLFFISGYQYWPFLVLRLTGVEREVILTKKEKSQYNHQCRENKQVTCPGYHRTLYVKELQTSSTIYSINVTDEIFNKYNEGDQFAIYTGSKFGRLSTLKDDYAPEEDIFFFVNVGILGATLFFIILLAIGSIVKKKGVNPRDLFIKNK